MLITTSSPVTLSSHVLAPPVYLQQTAEPVLQALLEESTHHIADLRGKLSVIVQYVYSLAASRLQPFLRGALVRRRLPDVRSEMLSHVSADKKVFTLPRGRE